MNVIRAGKMHVKVLISPMVFLLISALLSDASLSEASSEEGHGHKHHLGLFLGNTHHSSEKGFSIGTDYEYRVNDIIGVGGVAEYAGGNFHSWVFVAPLYIHPYKGLRFLAGPGFENEDGENEFLVRAGIAYQIPLSNGWSLTPEYNMDFIEGGEEVSVYGVSVGLGF